MNVQHVVFAASQRGRPVSEDTHLIRNDPGQPFFATVVDGHGWNERRLDIATFSQFIATKLAEGFAGRTLTDEQSDEQAFTAIFAEVDRCVAEKFDRRSIVAVATCVTIEDGSVPKLTIAHAGDCRLYKFSADERRGFKLLTKDHRIDNREEEARIKPLVDSGQFRIFDRRLGVVASHYQKPRLQYSSPPNESSSWSRAMLATTRGFGFRAFHPALSSVPSVTRLPLSSDGSFLFALCSDGGKKIVRKVFAQLKREKDPNSHTLEDLSRLAESKLAQKPGTPEHDVTVIFFRVSP